MFPSAADFNEEQTYISPAGRKMRLNPLPLSLNRRRLLATLNRLNEFEQNRFHFFISKQLVSIFFDFLTNLSHVEIVYLG